MGVEPSSTPQKKVSFLILFVLGCMLHSCAVAWTPFIAGSEPSSATIFCFAWCSMLETDTLHRIVQQVFVVACCMLHGCINAFDCRLRAQLGLSLAQLGLSLTQLGLSSLIKRSGPTWSSRFEAGPSPLITTLPILEMRTKYLTIHCPCGDTGIGKRKTCRNGITKEMPMEQTEDQNRAFKEDMIERMACHVQQVHDCTWSAAKQLVREQSVMDEWCDDTADEPARSRATPAVTSAAASSGSSTSRPQSIIGGAPQVLGQRELYDVSGTRVMVDLSKSTQADLRLLRLTINAMLQDGGGRS